MTRRGRQLDWSQSAGRPGGATVGGRSVGLEGEESQKSASVSVTGSNMPPTIHLDDDDEDVRISSPRSFAQARSAVSSSRQRSRTATSLAPSEHAGAEDLLELRLGPTNFTESNPLWIPVPPRLGDTRIPPNRSGPTNFTESDPLWIPVPPRLTRDRNGTFAIDLTKTSAPFDEDCIFVNKFVQKKRKPAQVVAEPVPAPAKELKLTCAICMDSMKEETSTTCGHIFCKVCIYGAIAVQKKCPTCREPLTRKQTHRIYISGSLRN